MPELISTAQPTARKAHRCGMCNAPIPPGETYRRDVYKYDTVYAFLTCLVCEQDCVVAEVYAEYDHDEGVTFEDAHEWAHEAVRFAKTDELREVAERWLVRSGCTCEQCEDRNTRDAEGDRK